LPVAGLGLVQSGQKQQETITWVDDHHLAVAAEFAGKFDFSGDGRAYLRLHSRGDHNSVKSSAKARLNPEGLDDLAFDWIAKLPPQFREGHERGQQLFLQLAFSLGAGFFIGRPFGFSPGFFLRKVLEQLLQACGFVRQGLGAQFLLIKRKVAARAFFSVISLPISAREASSPVSATA
jgi:hypothetical protein